MIRCLFFVSALLFPMGAYAQPSPPVHAPGMEHARHIAPPPSAAVLPVETGQSAFAAIQEIVTRLEADSATDWSKVNMEALRQHLIDMSNVTLSAVVVSQPIDAGARHTVTGKGAVRDSIRRMVRGHAETMNGVDGWVFIAAVHPRGATLVVKAAGPADVAKVRALGFIGAMTRGAHHQAHHLEMAAGRSPHR